MTHAKDQGVKMLLTADLRRLSQTMIHRRGAESAENGFFVCRETTTNKNIALLKTRSFAQPSSPDWAKVLPLRAWRLGAKIFVFRESEKGSPRAKTQRTPSSDKPEKAVGILFD